MDLSELEIEQLEEELVNELEETIEAELKEVKAKLVDEYK